MKASNCAGACHDLGTTIKTVVVDLGRLVLEGAVRAMGRTTAGLVAGQSRADRTRQGAG